MGGIICVDKRKSLRYLPPVLNFAKAYAIIAAKGSEISVVKKAIIKLLKKYEPKGYFVNISIQLSKIIGENSGGILYALSLSVKLFLNIQSNGRTIIKEKKIKII